MSKGINQNETCIVYYHEGEKFTRWAFLSKFKSERFIKQVKIYEGSEKDCVAINKGLNAIFQAKGVKGEELIKIIGLFI